MSVPEKGKVLPNKGKVFPAKEYAAAIASALRRDLGDTHRAVKTVARWTGASERTVKNWFAGLTVQAASTSSPWFIILMRCSSRS